MGVERKVTFEELQDRINPGPPKPKPAGKSKGETTGSTSTIRLDHSRLLKIESDHSIIEQIAIADVITARTQSNEREQCLFTRPVDKRETRGLPYNIHTLQFTVQNVKDLRQLTDVISRMKQGL